MLVRVGEGRAARLFAADDLLLVDQRVAIPALHKNANDADDLIGSAGRPSGLIGVRLRPDNLVHQPVVAGVEIGGAVLESKQVADRLLAELLDRVRRQEAVDLPAQRKQVRGAPQNVAQGMDVRFRGVRAELQNDVAVAEMRVERVVGKLLHSDQARRLQSLQPVALVEQRRAERDGHRQIVREDTWPKQAVVGRWISRVEGRRLAALHEKGDAFGQGSKQPLEPGAIVGENVEARDQRSRRLRRDHARLVKAMKRLRILRAVIAGSQRSGRRRARLRARAPSRWRRPPSPSGDRAFRVAARFETRRLPMRPTRTDNPPDPGATSCGSLAPSLDA